MLNFSFDHVSYLMGWIWYVSIPIIYAWWRSPKEPCLRGSYIEFIQEILALNVCSIACRMLAGYAHSVRALNPSFSSWIVFVFFFFCVNGLVLPLCHICFVRFDGVTYPCCFIQQVYLSYLYLPCKFDYIVPCGHRNSFIR